MAVVGLYWMERGSEAMALARVYLRAFACSILGQQHRYQAHQHHHNNNNVTTNNETLLPASHHHVLGLIANDVLPSVGIEEVLKEPVSHRFVHQPSPSSPMILPVTKKKRPQPPKAPADDMATRQPPSI